MIFVTALLWGAGISLGMCVGLVAWAFLRPLIATEKEVFDASLAAFIERNRLTVQTNVHLDRIGDSIEGILQRHAVVGRLPPTGDDVPIAVGDNLWSTEGSGIRSGIVKSTKAAVARFSHSGEYVITLAFGGGTWEVGNLNCYSTCIAARAVSVKNGDEEDCS